MIKLILLLGLLMQAQAYTYLTLVECNIEIGGYRGLYKSMNGNYYIFKFSNYCPYSYTID